MEPLQSISRRLYFSEVFEIELMLQGLNFTVESASAFETILQSVESGDVISVDLMVAQFVIVITGDELIGDEG
jgi:hypothetical protein